MQRHDCPTLDNDRHAANAGEENGACTEKFQKALQHLQRAANLAKLNRVDIWQFAVEAADLLSMDLTRLDIRWLICRGLIQHGYELESRETGLRQFNPESTGLIREESCFILSNPGSSEPFSDPHGCWQKSNEHPIWDSAARTLVFRGIIVKRFRCPALNQETILSAFQDEGWNNSILDPLPPIAGCDSKQRLHDAIRNLNRNQLHHLLQFRGNGTGQGISWEPRVSE